MFIAPTPTPQTNGAPRLNAWLSTRPASTSALATTITAATLAGAVVPAFGAGARSAGCRARRRRSPCSRRPRRRAAAAPASRRYQSCRAFLAGQRPISFILPRMWPSRGATSSGLRVPRIMASTCTRSSIPAARPPAGPCSSRSRCSAASRRAPPYPRRRRGARGGGRASQDRRRKARRSRCRSTCARRRDKRLGVAAARLDRPVARRTGERASISSAGMRARVPSTCAPALAKTPAAGAYRTSIPVSASNLRVACVDASAGGVVTKIVRRAAFMSLLPPRP